MKTRMQDLNHFNNYAVNEGLFYVVHRKKIFNAREYEIGPIFSKK